MNTLPKAYACAVICLLSFGLVGCDDLIKDVARTIVENDDKQKAQQNQAQAPAQPVQMYAVEPVPQQVPQQIPQQQIPQQQVPQYDYQQQVQAQIQPTAVPQAQPQYQAVNNVVPTAELPPKPVRQPAPPTTETVVRYRAKVLTQYGGKVLVRNAPSKRGKKLGFLYDQEEVFVVGETSNCEVINNISGCWVKVVDVNGLTGYSFGGYLNYNE